MTFIIYVERYYITFDSDSDSGSIRQELISTTENLIKTHTMSLFFFLVMMKVSDLPLQSMMMMQCSETQRLPVRGFSY